MSYIHLENLSLNFPIYGAGKQVFKKELLRLATGGLLNKGKDKTIHISALNDLSFKISSGMRLGLIGHNGSGKSTLLRTIAGIYEPTGGQIEIKGKVTPILDMMVGMSDESTGYENITVNALLHRLTKKEISQITKEVEIFSELGDYLHMPMRTYSAGMRMRLAFSIASNLPNDILVIDEVFGAGDKNFIEKATNRMMNMIDTSNIVVFASHDNELLRTFCTHVLWLDGGKIQFFGDIHEGLKKYLKN